MGRTVEPVVINSKDAKALERAEYEASFAQLPTVQVSAESVRRDHVTRAWLQSVKTGDVSIAEGTETPSDGDALGVKKTDE
jgi:hypothetical protein